VALDALGCVSVYCPVVLCAFSYIFSLLIALQSKVKCLHFAGLHMG
jgi:hypothetical protein